MYDACTRNEAPECIFSRHLQRFIAFHCAPSYRQLARCEPAAIWPSPSIPRLQRRITPPPLHHPQPRFIAGSPIPIRFIIRDAETRNLESRLYTIESCMSTHFDAWSSKLDKQKLLRNGGVSNTSARTLLPSEKFARGSTRRNERGR